MAGRTAGLISDQDQAWHKDSCWPKKF